MGYSFSGVFTNTVNKEIIDAAGRQWPFCTVYHVQKPFDGIAIYREPVMIDGTYTQSYNEKEKIVNELPEFSSRFPGNTFIYLWTDCHGGDCYYDGFACKNGKIIIDNRGQGTDHYSRSFELDKLNAVLETLDIYSGDRFEPFERGFFDEENNILYPEK